MNDIDVGNMLKSVISLSDAGRQSQKMGQQRSLA